MKLQNLHLVPANALIIKNGTVTVVETSPKKNFKTDGRDIIGYDLHCQARKGDIQKITIPSTLVKEVEALRKLLQESPVLVKLVEPELKAFAMVDDGGRLVSGVTAKSTGFQVVGKVEDDADDIVIDGEVN